MGLSNPLIQSWPSIIASVAVLVMVIGFLVFRLASQMELQWFKRWVPVLIWSALLLLTLGLLYEFIALNRLAN